MARKKTAKKATPKKTAKKTAKKPTAKKRAVRKKAAAKKTAPKKAAAKKAAPKKAAAKKAAAKKPRKKRVAKASGEQTLNTLVAVSEKTGISMPTLLRYKKAYQRRIPSVGKGRTQRYPDEALAVFLEIKQENLKKRGRPKKKAAAKKRPAKRVRKARAAAKPTRRGKKPAAKKQAAGLLTLTEVGRRTGISYPTLVRYVKLHPERIPHEGKGRKRRFPPSAVPVFRKIRSESRRGPKKVGRKVTRKAPARRRATVVTDRSLARRIKALEKAQADIGKQLAAVIKLLKKPVKVTISSD